MLQKDLLHRVSCIYSSLTKNSPPRECRTYLFRIVVSQVFRMRAALFVKDAMDGTISAWGEMTGELGYEVLKGA